MALKEVFLDGSLVSLGAPDFVLGISGLMDSLGAFQIDPQMTEMMKMVILSLVALSQDGALSPPSAWSPKTPSKACSAPQNLLAKPQLKLSRRRYPSSISWDNHMIDDVPGMTDLWQQNAEPWGRILWKELAVGRCEKVRADLFQVDLFQVSLYRGLEEF